MSFPDTNSRLLARLQDATDEQAWFEFVELYRPAILRLAAHKGLQPNDCDDLAQNVLVSIAGAIERWQSDEVRGRFRTWLYTIAHRKVIDALRARSTAAVVSGGSSVQQLLNDQEARKTDSRLLRTELRRQVFRHVAAAVQNEFEHATWTCFWMTAVEGVDVVEVAQKTGKSVGAVYAAKGRIARRLIERVREFAKDCSLDELEGLT